MTCARAFRDGVFACGLFLPRTCARARRRRAPSGRRSEARATVIVIVVALRESRARANDAHPTTTRRCARSARSTAIRRRTEGDNSRCSRSRSDIHRWRRRRPPSTVAARWPWHHHTHHHTPTAMAIAGASMGKNPSRGRRTRGRIIAAPRLIAQRGRKWRHRCVE